MSQHLDEQMFSGSLLFSGVALLNWFTKSSTFKRKEGRKKMMELRFAKFICAGEICSRDPSEGL